MLKKHEKKKILITGSDGFIGNNLKRFFRGEAGEDFEVYGTTYFKEPGKNEIKFDVTCQEDFEKLWDIQFDVIIHTIGIVDQNAPRVLMKEVNAKGTGRMARWARHHNCKHFIYLSSISVYGPVSVGVERTEDSFWIGKTPLPYGKTKEMGEKLLIGQKIPYTILRLPAVIGENNTLICRAIIPRILEDGMFSCGAGDKKISILTVRSLGAILERLIMKGPLHGCFNCGCHSPTWNEFIAEFFHILDKPLKIKRKSVLSTLGNLGDKDFLLIASFSAWGAHFPSEKLVSLLHDHIVKEDWRDALRDSVETYLMDYK